MFVSILKEEVLMLKKLFFTTILILAISVLGTGLVSAEEKLADLVMKEFKIEPASPLINEEFNVNMIVTNEGDDVAINPFMLMAIKGVQKITVNLPIIQPGQTYKAVIPTTISVEGKFEARAVVDSNRRVKESNEANNRKELEIVVDDPSTLQQILFFTFDTTTDTKTQILQFSAPKTTFVQETYIVDIKDKETDENGPDLAIKELSALPGTNAAGIQSSKIKQGEAAVIYFKVKNIGKKNAQSTDAQLRFGPNVPIQSVNIPYLAKGAVYDKYLKVTFPDPGKRTISIEVNETKAFKEVSFENNSMSKEITVAEVKKPDLIVQSITFSNPTPVTDEKFTVYIKVKNKGTAQQYRSAKGSISFGPAIPASTFDITNLPAGGAIDYRFPIKIDTASTLTIKAIVDIGDKVSESNEKNNEKTKTIDIAEAPKPDLIIKTISAGTKKLFKGDKVSISVIVKNRSKGPSTPCKLGFSVAPLDATGIVVKSRFPIKTIPALQPGEAQTFDNNYKLQYDGKYKVTAYADAENVVEEDNENNNKKEFTFDVFVIEKPDLTIHEFGANKTTINVGESVNFTAVISNKGKGKAPMSEISIYPGYLMRSTPASIKSLGSMQSSSFSKTFKYNVPGEYKAGVVIDGNDKIDETNENNNREEITIRVIEKLPDLRVRLFRVKPNQIKADEQVELILFVKNRGEAKSEKCKAFFYWNPLGPPLEVDIAPLNPGERKKYVRKVTYNKAGSYKCKVVIDPTNEIKESRETNNESGVKTVTVVE